VARKVFVLEVDEDKAASLIEALSARSFLSVYTLDRETRKAHKSCPCCGKRLSKEVVVDLGEDLLRELLRIVKAMQVSKSVILVNKDNPKDRLPPGEFDRCLEMSPLVVTRLEDLGLIRSFQDGARKTYHVSAQALSFLQTGGAYSPAFAVYVDKVLVDKGGSVAIEDLSFKLVSAGRFRKEAFDLVDQLPERIVGFVMTGQIPLV